MMPRTPALVALWLVAMAPAARAQCPDGSPPPCAPSRAGRPVPAASDRPRHLMFLPFRNVTRRPEHEWLVSGAPLMLGQVLGQFRDLHVVPDERLNAARRRLRLPADSVPDATQLRSLAQETGGWTAVTGDVFSAGPRIRVTLRAFDVPTGRVVARAEREADGQSDLREAFDALSLRLLEPAGVPATGTSLVALTTSSVDAYRAYVRGLDHYHRSEYRDALRELTEAVRLDTTFALGWASLAFASVSAHGFQEMLRPASLAYRAIDRAARNASRLPASQAALTRVMQAFARAQFAEAKRIADSLVVADPQDVSAIELLAVMHSMSLFISQTVIPSEIARDVNRAVTLTRRLLTLDPSRRMAYSLPTMIYGFSGGLWWGHTWGDTRQFTSLPFMIMSVSSRPQASFVPLFRDSIVFLPIDTFKALPRDEQHRLRRPGADRAMEWVEEWLAAAPDDADAHLWASRIAELQGNSGRALREFVIADSLGIQTGIENGPGRHLSLLVFTGAHDRAGAMADSLLRAGAMSAPPFLASIDRRWTYGAAALLLSRRWESAARLAELINARRKLPTPCESLAEELGLVDAPVPPHVRSAVLDTLRAHAGEARAVPLLVPCIDAWTAGTPVQRPDY